MSVQHSTYLDLAGRLGPSSYYLVTSTDVCYTKQFDALQLQNSFNKLCNIRTRLNGCEGKVRFTIHVKASK